MTDHERHTARIDVADAAHQRCVRNGWSTDWDHRGVYLHLEASELIEAIRGKNGSIVDEAADVLATLMAMTVAAGVTWDAVERRLAEMLDVEMPDSDPHTETLYEGRLDQMPSGPMLYDSGRSPGTRVRVVRADTPHHKATQ